MFKSKEKIAKEILLMNKDTKNEVQSALNKYTFSNEVFIPTPLRITKKEYFGKDYLLNNLVDFERNSLQKKQLIEPLNTETKLGLTYVRRLSGIMSKGKTRICHG